MAPPVFVTIIIRVVLPVADNVGEVPFGHFTFEGHVIDAPELVISSSVILYIDPAAGMLIAENVCAEPTVITK
jgi:hypothetical protein